MNDIQTLMRSANPIPDAKQEFTNDEVKALLTLTMTRSGDMQTTQPQGAEPPHKQRRSGWVIAAATFPLVIAVGLTAGLLSSRSTDGEPATIVARATTVQQDTTTTTETSREPISGPVTIETLVDFTTEPTTGAFEVTEGEDTLGCSSGTFYDTFDFDTEDVTRNMSCSEGDTGAFIMVFDPDGHDTGPGEENGPWRIVGGDGSLHRSTG
jgi:hypothetical protein